MERTRPPGLFRHVAWSMVPTAYTWVEPQVLTILMYLPLSHDSTVCRSENCSKDSARLA